MSRSSHRFLSLAVCVGLALATGCRREETPKTDGPAAAKPEKPKSLTGREVLDRMVSAYQKASTYADAGTVRLLAETGDQKIDQTSDFSVTLVRPNKLRVVAYQVQLVCDGRKTYASIAAIPNEVLVKRAPPKVNMQMFRSDPNLAMAIGDFAGPPPQLLLLLANDPLNSMLREAEEPKLLESDQIDGRDCYRVQIVRPDGTGVFWIDQKTLVLRRIVFPTDELRQQLAQGQPIDKLLLVAEFSKARLNAEVDAKAFAFEIPKKAEIVKFFVPPHIAQLLGKKMPDFKFFALDGKPVTPESFAGKTVVLEFWATWCGYCKMSLPNLEKVREQFKNNPKVAFYAVSVDRPQVDNKELVHEFEELKVRVPILRDTEQSAAAFKVSGYPTMFIIDSQGIVQDYEASANPKLAEVLPQKLDKVLAGENIYEPLLKEYQEQVERLRQYAETQETPGGEPLGPGAGAVLREEKLPEVKTAPRSQPATMKLTRLWKCAEVKSPGNVLVLSDKNGPPRLAVVENWKTVAEVGLDGKLVALHQLKIADGEMIGSLRSAAGADGRRYVVAFLTGGQRCHVLDGNWNLVASYPENALQNPHSGIVDVELGDLDGDGKLKLYVGYLGVVGVQAASLEGKRLWSNRSLANAGGMAIGPADAKGRRDLYCTNGTGSLVVLDALGQRKTEIQSPARMLNWIVAADLRGDGQLLWCGMAAQKLGENLAVGLSLRGEELWTYPLPAGIQPQPIEPIIPGRLTREGPGQWLLPGPDGSIHLLAADGKPWDKFSYGAPLAGLATVEIDGRPALVVATPNGLEAWKVE